MASVNGKTVLLTGAAGGIGVEVARRLHDRGANLVLTDLDDAQLDALATRLGGDRVLTVASDVRDFAAMQAVVDQGVERFGGIDVVIANAGIGSYGSVLQVDPKAFRQLLEVNVLGVFHTVRAALPAVIERRGYVLIVSSLAAYVACPGLAPYNASKAAVEQFANALRLEVGYRGVDVGSAHMSWIDTAMVSDSSADLPTFKEMLSKLPGPLSRTTSVGGCGRAFVRGIERRSKRINSPAWVGLLRWLRPLAPLGEIPVRRFVPDLLPRMDAEVAALGRWTSAHTDSLEKR